MPRPKPDNEKIAKRVALACRILLVDGDDAMKIALDGLSPLRARNYSAGRSGRGVASNTTADAACARADRRGPDAYDEIVRAINDLYHSALRVEGLIGRQMAVVNPRVPTAEDMRRMGRDRKRGSGICVACGADVSGNGEDRIKSGLGPGCYKAMRRSEMTRLEYVDWVKVAPEERGACYRKGNP